MSIRSIAGLLIFTCVGVFGQSGDEKPAFEVASIKPSPPPAGGRIRIGMNGGPGTPDPGRYTCTFCTLLMLITQAYDVPRFQISAPDWLDDVHFEIVAKVPRGATKEQFRLMLQTLLAERFKLTLHREKKDMPGYQLLVAKNGPKLKESMEDPESNADAAGPPPLPAGPPKMDKDGYPILPHRQGTMMFMGIGRARMQAEKETLEHFATQLSGLVGKPVTDATGLKGKYDFTLTFAPEPGQGFLTRLPPPPGGPPGPDAGTPATPQDSLPTVFTALQEQLGLKLEQKKGPVDTLVIDHAEKVPTEN
jgi:uncharacterized protein (TIGR03435 family)